MESFMCELVAFILVSSFLLQMCNYVLLRLTGVTGMILCIVGFDLLEQGEVKE